MTSQLTNRTIDDFGDQWTRYTGNEGFYGSPDLLADILGPILEIDALKGKRIAEIGSGTGRIVHMLLASGAEHVTALEPSRAMSVLRDNTRREADRITYLQCRGEELPTQPAQDIVVSIGVLHHIPDPAPVVAAAYNALKPGGQMVVWLYGWEGNAAYLWLILPLRAVTIRLPHKILSALCHGLNGLLGLYIRLARLIAVPLHRYMTGVIGRFSSEKRYLVIYDQLNPAYAKYYTEAEARQLLERAGLKDIVVYHRHGYSWTVRGRRPMDAVGAT